jgi:ribonuclease E
MSNDDVAAPTATEPTGGDIPADDPAALARASFAAGKPIARPGARPGQRRQRTAASTATVTAPVAEPVTERETTREREVPRERPAPRPRAGASTEAPETVETAVDTTEAPERAPRPPRAPRQPRPRPAAPEGEDGATAERAQPRPRTRRPATDDMPIGDTERDAEDGGETTGDDTGSTTSSARRRRRRGGRGRGRGGAARPAGTTGDDVTLVDEDTPEGDSVQSQRDDATPDETTTPAPARRRRSGGTTSPQRETRPDDGADEDEPKKPAARTRTRTRSGAAMAGSSDEPKAEPRRRSSAAAGSKPTATKSRAKAEPQTKTEAKTDGKKADAKKAEPRARRTTRSREADVAAGGPTRLRSSRSRTGGGRESGPRTARGRRREQIPIPPRVTDKLMVITEHGERDQIAILEGRELVQHYVTRSGAKSMVGNVYLGRVQNVLPGMEAAFIDIGRGRNGVLYAGEVNYSPEDLEGPAPRIENVLKSGQAVMVQVTKDPMGGKGARLTAQISMPGRFLVLAPDQDVSGISRRLNDDERKRLKGILKKIRPEHHGVIVRTAAEGAPEEAFTADLERLVRTWEDIQKKAKKAKAPAELYEEPELTVRVVRDLFVDEEFRGLVTDSQRVYDKVMEYVDDVATDLKPKVSLHTGKLSAFEEYHVVEQIYKALDRKVWLPSGGYLIIERTEAMTIIDVNTGKSVGKTNLEETVKNTNLEAAREAARQLRLRDIGGIIVIDFIDMLLEKNKKEVEDTMQEALAVDKTRSQIFEIGPLGLMQVTRKRVSGGLVESFSETCPTCEGRGIILTYEA